METTTSNSAIKKSEPNDPTPNPLNLQKDELVMMDVDTDNPVEVKIVSVGVHGYGASVREIVTNKGWSCSIKCLTRKD